MLRTFIRYYKPHIKLFILDMVCALIISGIDLVFPIITRNVLNIYIPDRNLNMIIIIGVSLVVAYGIRFLLSYIIGYYGHVMGIRLESDMRRDLFKKFQVLDYQYFDDKKTGELLSNLTTHLHDISEASHHAPEDLFISGLMLIGSFIILMLTNIYLTLIIYVFLAMLIIYSLSRRKKMLKVFREVRTSQGELASQIESSLTGIRLTKAYNNERYEEKKFALINEEYKAVRSETFKQIGLFGSGNEFFINLTNLALLVFGGIFVIFEIGNVTYVDLTTYFLYINFLIKPISRLVNSTEQIQQAISGIEKFYKVIEERPSITSKEDAITKTNFEGKIEFRDVEFSYTANEDEHILHNFNLIVEKGKKIAIVGETGAGKTTISKLVPRFYDVNKGQVLVDDVDVKDYELYCLRKAIGHVQQDVVIFYGTIKDNILYGNPDATDEDIIKAAKNASIHDFIMTLEHGYDTLVGERGIKLSGGQKQRISIARLFLKNPAILILDEATSSLDNITEKQIQNALDELAKNKTTIMIAHRLSTIKNADEIIVISHDGIIERGTHQDLIKQNGYYSELYNATITI